jgi:arylsulfatase
MLATVATCLIVGAARAQEPTATPSNTRPNILVIVGDDIGQFNISAYSFGVVGYKASNIDTIAGRWHDRA